MFPIHKEHTAIKSDEYGSYSPYLPTYLLFHQKPHKELPEKVPMCGIALSYWK
jgi:hypothetical protein